MDIVALLEHLIAIKSPTGSEEPILDDLASRFRGAASGLGIHRSPSGLVVMTEGRPEPGPRPPAPRPFIVLAGHVDTVPAQGDPGPRRQGDLLYGLGASDMKSGLAVMVQLGLTLDWRTLPADLALVFYGGEEGPFEGNTLGRLLEEVPLLLEADLAVLMEPTDNQIELGCVGCLNVEVAVPGEPCHSARPWLGRSAVGEAASWILEMSRREPVPRIVEGLLFRETAAITLLSSGSARNVIPGSLTANVNLRYAPDRTGEDVLREFSSGLPASWTWRLVDEAPPGRIDAGAPQVRRFLETVERPRRAKQGWTDVARFTARGVPAINFGPGIPELAHRRDEHVPVKNLEESLDWMRLFLQGS